MPSTAIQSIRAIAFGFYAGIGIAQTVNLANRKPGFLGAL
jgi:hypothetical protein